MRRILLVSALVVAGSAACAHDSSVDSPVAPSSPIRAITLSPSEVALVPGGAVQLFVTVSGLPGNDQRVRWSLIGSPYVFVSSTGLLAACWPGGHATILATTLADRTLSASSDVVAASPALAVASFATISYSPGSAPARLDSLAGVITVTGNFVPPAFSCVGATEVDLVASSLRGDTIVGSFPFPTSPIGPTPLSFTFNSAAILGGQPVFPNGSYGLRLDAVFIGMTPIASNTLAVTIRNP